MTVGPAKELVERGRGFWETVQRTRVWRTFSHFIDVGGPVLSGGMSYQALFAVFAGLLVGLGIFGMVLRNQEELLDTIVVQLNLFIPGLIGNEHSAIPMSTVHDMLDRPWFGWTSIVGGATLVWIAVNWFTGTRRSIRIIFGLEVKQYRNPIVLKARDFVLAISFFLAIIISGVLTVVSSNITDLVLSWFGANPDNWFFGGLGTVVRYGAVFVFDVLILLAIHRYLAEVRIGRWRLLSGCFLGAGALFVLKLLGTALLGGATNNTLLAPFVIFVGLLLWFNFICRALLLTSAWIATGLDPELGVGGGILE